MPERVWYRSLYWRIALGYIALLALLLLVQTGLSVWLTNRMWGRASRTPTQLAELVAQDLSAQLEQAPQTDVEQLPAALGRWRRLPAVRRRRCRRHARTLFEPPGRGHSPRTSPADAAADRGGCQDAIAIGPAGGARTEAPGAAFATTST